VSKGYHLPSGQVLVDNLALKTIRQPHFTQIGFLKYSHAWHVAILTLMPSTDFMGMPAIAHWLNPLANPAALPQAEQLIVGLRL
jgi:anthranilate phosphoribosyltransferase